MGFISVETQYESADKAHGKILSDNFLRLDVNLFEQYHKDVSYDWLRERCHFRAKKEVDLRREARIQSSTMFTSVV